MGVQIAAAPKRLTATQLASLAFLMIGLSGVARRVWDAGFFSVSGCPAVEKLAAHNLAITIFLGTALIFGLFIANILRYYLGAWLVELSPPTWRDKENRESGFIGAVEETLRYLALVVVYAALWIMQRSSRRDSLARTLPLLVLLVALFVIWDVVTATNVRRAVKANPSDGTACAWRIRACRWFWMDAAIVLALVAWIAVAHVLPGKDPLVQAIFLGGAVAVVGLISMVLLVWEIVAEQRVTGTLGKMLKDNVPKRIVLFGVAALVAAVSLFALCQPCQIGCSGVPQKAPGQVASRAPESGQQNGANGPP